MAARNAGEGCLIRSVPFVDQSAARALLTGVAWIDGDNRHSEPCRLVSKECAELAKRPVGQAVAMFAPGRYPSADMGQFLDRNSAPGAFSINHDSLRDRMVGMFLEPRLFAGKFFEPTFGGLGAAFLERGATAGKLGTDTLKFSTSVNLAVACGRDIDDTEINAEPILGFERLSFWNVAGAGEIPFASYQTEISLTFAEGQQVSLMPSRDETDLHSSFDGPDRNNIVAAKTKDALVVRLGSVGAENGSDLAIDFEGVGDLRDGSNSGLRGEFKVGTGRRICQFVQVKLSKDASHKPFGGDGRAGFITTPQCCFQDTRLRPSRQEFDGSYEFHASNIDTSLPKVNRKVGLSSLA